MKKDVITLRQKESRGDSRRTYRNTDRAPQRPEKQQKKRRRTEKIREKQSPVRRILSPKGLLATAVLSVCFGFPAGVTAESWPMQNNLRLCVRLAACTGAVVFAVLAVLFAYDKKRLPVCLGILFAICFALEQLPVPIGAAGEILRVIRMADAVLCVACGILPAFLVYLLLQLFGGRMPNGTAYQILRWILIAVIGFLFGCLLYRFVFCRQGSSSGREKRRKRQSRREKQKKKKGRKEKKKAEKQERKKATDPYGNSPDNQEKLPAREEHTSTPANPMQKEQDLSGRVVIRQDGCAGFVRNFHGAPVILFEDGSTAPVQFRDGQYFYEAEPGAWKKID